MQNITDEKLKADAARLGFHKRPMGDLIKLIEARVQDDVQKIVSEVIDEVGASSMKDMGKVMGSIMQKVAGQADGGLIQQLVRKELSS